MNPSCLILILSRPFFLAAHVYTTSMILSLSSAIRFSFWIVATACLISAQFFNGYIHDGSTTYCWKSIPKNTSSMGETPRILAKGVGPNCPLTLSMNVSKSSIEPFEPLEIKWTVQISNLQALNMTDIIPSPVTSDPDRVADIVHSNVHSCEFGSNCDPFHDGRQSLTPTPNQYADFNDHNTSNFRSQALTFTQDGLYTLVGHVILYGRDSNESDVLVQYDFAIYDQLLVKAVPVVIPTGTVIPVVPIIPDDDTTSQDTDNDVDNWSLLGILVVTLAFLLFSLTIVYVFISRKQLLQQQQRSMSSSGTSTHEYYTGPYVITPRPEDPAGHVPLAAAKDPRKEEQEQELFNRLLLNVSASMGSPRFQDANDSEAKECDLQSSQSKANNTTATVHDRHTPTSYSI